MYNEVNLSRHAKSKERRRVNRERCVIKKDVSQRDTRYARNKN